MPAEDVPPATPPGTKGYYDQDPDGEWTAGFIDGLAIGRLEAIGEVRNRLAVHGLGINADARVGPVTEPDFTAPLPLRVPDNPLENPHYDEGLRAGCSRGFTDAVAELRSALVAHGLDLDDDVSVAPLDLARFASRTREHHAGSPALDPAAEASLTDAALHAFLDKAEASPSTFHPEPETMLTLDSERIRSSGTVLRRSHSQSGTEAPPPFMPNKFAAVTRRRLLTGLFGTAIALASGLVGYFVRPKAPNDHPRRTQLDAYKPPSVWSVLPADERDVLVALDQWVHTQEHAGQESTVHAALQLVMGLPGSGYDDLKRRVITAVSGAQRNSYVETITTSGISQSQGSPEIRRMIYSMVDRCIMRGGHGFLSPATRARLEFALANIETDPRSTSMLNEVIQKLISLGL